VWAGGRSSGRDEAPFFLSASFLKTFVKFGQPYKDKQVSKEWDVPKKNYFASSKVFIYI
jgi:hypothetical protein